MIYKFVNGTTICLQTHHIKQNPAKTENHQINKAWIQSRERARKRERQRGIERKKGLTHHGSPLAVVLSQPNPPDQLKPKIIRSFELGFDLERENDGERDRRWGLG